MLYLSEVPDGLRFLKSCVNEIATKVNKITKVVGRLEEVPIHKLILRVETLGDKATRAGDFERGIAR